MGIAKWDGSPGAQPRWSISRRKSDERYIGGPRLKNVDAADGSFDPIAEGYDFLATLYGPQKNPLFLADPPSQRRSALDVGCGSGVLAEALSNDYERVVGLDISEEMLRIARVHRSRPNIEYVLADANTVQLEERFDLICSANTLHHVEDLKATLGRLRSLLHPRGRLVILDNIAEGVYKPNSRVFRGRPPSWIFLIAPFIDFWDSWRRFGFENAFRALRFKLGRPWRRHLSADRYLTEEGFRQVYRDALPGCDFTRVGIFMLVSWRAPEAG